MSCKYVLDSSAWVEYFNGSQKGLKIKSVVEKEAIGSSIIAIAELADKFGREQRPFKAELQFIQSRAMLVPLTISIALKAAKLKTDIRQKNPKFGLADGVHLATALQERAILLTTDTDFVGVEGASVI